MQDRLRNKLLFQCPDIVLLCRGREEKCGLEVVGWLITPELRVSSSGEADGGSSHLAPRTTDEESAGAVSASQLSTTWDLVWASSAQLQILLMD